MKIHYYLGWFENYLPEKISQMLQEDIKERKSLVLISANPSDFEDRGETEISWLNKSRIIFDEYHLINYQIEREEAIHLVKNASVIFLLGGRTLEQNVFLSKYKLDKVIKESEAIVIGASAGAINMSKKWFCSKYTSEYCGESYIRNGIGLDNISILSHCEIENNLPQIQKDLTPLSMEMNIYASNENCCVRVKGEKVSIIGDVYLIDKGSMDKLKEII